MLDAWHVALTWFLFVAVWLLRASLLCNAQAFHWKHFYRQTVAERQRHGEALWLLCFFFVFVFLQLCSFIANFLSLSFLFWAVWFLSALTTLTPSKWLCPPPPPLPRLQEKLLKNGIRYVVCIVVYHFSHTHTHPSLLSAGARRLCLFYCGLGRAPVWAACHSPGYSMYSESCASFFFFFFLCCLFFQIIVWQRWLWWLFCFFVFSGACEPSRPRVWVEVHCSERLIMEKCVYVFFLV